MFPPAKPFPRFIAGVQSACNSGTAGACVITATPSANKLVSVLSGTAATSAEYKVQ